MEKNLLTIGELAKICDVSLKTLRYYDEIGLLNPVEINSENNYRFYSPWQINRILTIKELKKTGFILEAIKDCLSSDGQNFDLSKLEQLLDVKENDIDRQIAELNVQKQKIHAYKNYYPLLEKKILDAQRGIHTEYISPRKFVFKHYEGGYDHEIFRRYFKTVSEAIYEHNSTWSGIPAARFFERFNFDNIKADIGYIIESEIPLQEGFVENIDQDTYAVYIYQGNYISMVGEGYSELFSWIEKEGFYVNGPSIECYYVGENVTNEGNQYISEIQIPVKKY